MPIRSTALFVVGMLLCFGLGAAPALAQALVDPNQVVEGFEIARGAGDLDAAMAQLADDAVVTVQGRTTRAYAGRSQVRMYMETFGVRFQTIMRSKPLVEGNRVTWTERDEYASGQAVDSTVIAIVTGNRISSLIYRNSDPFGGPPTASKAGATAQARELPSVTWPAALALLGFGVLALVFGRPRRRASQSQLDGRLLFALQRQRAEGEPQAHDRAA
jgi:hypothetical protein